MTDVAKPVQRAEDGAGTPTVWRRMGVWAVGHAVDDLHQGLVPACVLYFVLDRHYSYVAVAGLTFAAAMGSSIPQPFFGVAVDRYRLDWFASAGVAIAGIGLGLAGLVEGYPAVWRDPALRAGGGHVPSLSRFFLAPVLGPPGCLSRSCAWRRPQRWP